MGPLGSPRLHHRPRPAHFLRHFVSSPRRAPAKTYPNTITVASTPVVVASEALIPSTAQAGSPARPPAMVKHNTTRRRKTTPTRNITATTPTKLRRPSTVLVSRLVSRCSSRIRSIPRRRRTRINRRLEAPRCTRRLLDHRLDSTVRRRMRRLQDRRRTSRDMFKRHVV